MEIKSYQLFTVVIVVVSCLWVGSRRCREQDQCSGPALLRGAGIICVWADEWSKHQSFPVFRNWKLKYMNQVWSQRSDNKSNICCCFCFVRWTKRCCGYFQSPLCLAACLSVGSNRFPCSLSLRDTGHRVSTMEGDEFHMNGSPPLLPPCLFPYPARRLSSLPARKLFPPLLDFIFRATSFSLALSALTFDETVILWHECLQPPSFSLGSHCESWDIW